jgi:hypothetical protein
MHTIIGTGNLGFKLINLIILPAFLTGCHLNQQQNETETETLAKVKVTHVQKLDLFESAEFVATTVYIDKSEIYAPASGYITGIGAVQGEKIEAGRLLFTLETREHRALIGDTLMKQQNLSKLGIFKVIAPGNGYITELSHQSGDYVSQGTILCNFTRTDNLYFKAYIPFKFIGFAGTGIKCKIKLPDSSEIGCTIDKSLNTVDPGSQAIQILIKTGSKTDLPEGLNAMLLLPIKKIPDAQVVPVSAVLANETLDQYWIVKIVEDSMAVKIPIKKGVRQDEMIQIIEPLFEPNDRILIEGNYGLPDTTKVEIINQ